jgi:hypothetical protein
VVRNRRVLIDRCDQNGQIGRHSLSEERQPGAEGDRCEHPAQPDLHYDFDFDGKLYRGRYEAIITRELWQSVQDVFERRQRRSRQMRKHDFAFSGLITCGQCGCSLVGEIKKGLYIYYHCSCAKPYVREEVLEAELTKAIQELVFTPKFLEDAKVALQQSRAKETQERDQAVARLQAEQTKLERWIEAIYEDKLDGTIDEAFFRRKTDECRAGQAKLAEEITRHRHAAQCETFDLAELAERAAELFELQPAREKRKLLRFVVQECKWTAGRLTYRWKAPVERVARGEEAKAA